MEGTLMDKYICAEKGHSFEMIRIDPAFPHGCISGICKSTCRICGKEEWSYETTGGGCPVEVSEKCSCGCRVYYVDSMTMTCAACGKTYSMY